MGLVPRPSQSNLFWAKTHLYVLPLLFHPFLFFYLPSDIIKFQKYSSIFLNLFVDLLYFLDISL